MSSATAAIARAERGATVPAMRCACIDVGSNTTRLLVAEPAPRGLRELRSERAYTRIGADAGPTGELSRAKIAEVADVVAAQLDGAREVGAGAVRAVATAAVRAAANRDQLVAAVAERTGLALDVISEREEARLTFAGATRTGDEREGARTGVVDVGGGSSELVAGTLAGGPEWSISLQVGSGVLTEAHAGADPPSAAQLRAMHEHAAGAFEGIAPPPVERAIAVGGTATALRALTGGVLEPETLQRALRAVVSAPAADVAARHAIDSQRVRLLPAGIMLLEQAAASFDAPLRIGRGGLREGVVLELADALAAR